MNGGGAVALQFQRNPFHPIKRTVVVPWNDIIVMLNPVVMSSAPSDDTDASALPDPFNTGSPHLTWIVMSYSVFAFVISLCNESLKP